MSPWDHDTAEAYRKLGQQAHVPILRPVVAELLGDLTGGLALDFGCGPGDLTALLAELGARRVIAVDESEEMVREARSAMRERASGVDGRIKICQGDERMLPLAEPCAGVLSSLVLMMCSTRERLQRAADGLVGSLARSGRLVVVMTHPCFRTAPADTFHDEVPPHWSYWASGTPYDVVLHPEPAGSATAVITDYHWTLEDMVGAFAKAGGVVRDVRELPAARDASGRPQGLPAYVVVSISRLQGP